MNVHEILPNDNINAQAKHFLCVCMSGWLDRTFYPVRILGEQIFIENYSAVIQKGIHGMVHLDSTHFLWDNCTTDYLKHGMTEGFAF